MLEKLKERVCEQNLQLVKYGLVVLTWGNVSALSEDGKYVVIKPSGVSYDNMKAGDMVVTDRMGNIVEGDLRPSTDLATHLALYDAFPGIGGAVHTHSRYAVAAAQAGLDLPCYGTTHADYFYGAVPCARELTAEEIEEAYERNTGLVIAETFRARGIDPLAVPAVLVKSHGPFTWGKDADEAVYHAVVLEEVAFMNFHAKMLNPAAGPMPQVLLDKHYLRKHGANAYYGQGNVK